MRDEAMRGEAMRQTGPGEAEAPSKIAWPPLLILATLVGGALLDIIFPLAGAWPWQARAVGGAVIALALCNDAWCATIMKRSGTTIRPDRAVSSLVTEGPFRWSRNPIYVSHVATVAALGLVFASPWIVILTPALAIGLQRLAIEREERHLSQRFGAEFDAYAERTRRWL